MQLRESSGSLASLRSPPLLGIVLSFWAVCCAGADPFVRGDANLDGVISLADASLISDLFVASPPQPKCEDSADVTDNGALSPADVFYLLSWIFRGNTTPPPPPIPAPFPARDADPTADALDCADSKIKPAGPPDPEYKLQWEGPEAVVRGQGGVEIFLRASTGAPIQAFSIAYRVNRKLIASVQVDFEGTIFPAARRTAFEASPVFRVETHPSADPNFDVLLVGAIFVEPFGLAGGNPLLQRIQFPATVAPIQAQRLLRLKVDIRNDAPVGKGLKALAPALGVDLQDPTLGGVYNEFVARERLLAGLAGTLTVNTGINFGEFLFVRGDANHDGSVDIADAVYTLWYVAAGGAEPPCRIAADVQDDDEVNLSDPVYTLNWLFRGGESMPAPNVFTGCQRTRVVLYSDESPCLTSECP